VVNGKYRLRRCLGTIWTSQKVFQMGNEFIRRRFIRASKIVGAAIGGGILPPNIVRVKNTIGILSLTVEE